MELVHSIIGLLKIHGVKIGENLDTSELEEEMVLAVSTAILLLPLFLSKYLYYN
jgi:hypothetical protein